MSQAVLPFFESAEAATAHAIRASGKEPKDVAGQLWPEKTVARAQTDLLNALNENRSERLTADQHVLIANYCRRFDFLQYVALQCSHSQPVLVTPAEQTARVQEEIFRKGDELRALLNQLDLLKPRQ